MCTQMVLCKIKPQISKNKLNPKTIGNFLRKFDKLYEEKIIAYKHKQIYMYKPLLSTTSKGNTKQWTCEI